MVTVTNDSEMPKLSRKRLDFVTHYLTNGGNATKAALDAGYTPKYPDREGSRLLKNADVCRAIELKQRQLAVRNDYSIATWLKDQLEFQQEARAAGSWSAVARFSELLGRHIGALSDNARLSHESEELFGMLRVAMGSVMSQRVEVLEDPEVETVRAVEVREGG